MTYGADKAICVLVSGPFGNLPDGTSLGLVVDLITQEKATAWNEMLKVHPNATLDYSRRDVVH